MSRTREERFAARERIADAPATRGGRRGTCLELWARSQVKAELWSLMGQHTRSGRWKPATPSGAVQSSRLPLDEQARLLLARRAVRPLASDEKPRDALLGAWVELIRSRLDSRSLCFFTGTYGDEYGYSRGLMLPRNVQTDFRRALAELEVEGQYVCAVENHKTGRAILHCHALVDGLSDEDMAFLKHHWDTTRGWSTAPRCIDGGVSYTVKYALKGSADSFDWRFAS